MALKNARLQAKVGDSAIRVRYTISMTRDVSFQLDVEAANEILTSMAAPIIKQSADAIAARAKSMVTSMTSQSIDVSVTESVGIIRRGNRAIARVSANGADSHGNYIGHQALMKARDAGRI